MTTSAPPRARATPARLGTGGGFVAASASLILVFVAAGAPIPLMATYRAAEVDNTALALASVAYFVAAAAGLLVLGRLSTHVGRRPAGLLALAVAGLGCVVMALVDGPAWLIVGRGLQGLACGVAPGPLAAFVVDTSRERQWLAALITGSAPMIGLPLGAALAGLVAELGPGTSPWIFVGLVVALAFCAVGLWLSPETVRRSPGALASLRPRVQLSRRLRRATLAAAAVFVATWPLGGFYQAFGSVVADDVLGSRSPFAAGVIFASIMVLNPVGGVLARRVAPRRGVVSAMVGYAIILIGAALALRVGNAWLFVGASLIGGLLQGVAATCAMRILLPRTRIADRSDVFAAIYLIAYASVAIAGVGAARLAEHLPLDSVVMVYVATGLIGALAAGLLPPRHVPPRRGSQR